MKNIILTLTLILGFTTVSFCDDPPPFNPNGPDSIPVDGGVLVLVGAGVGYGIKKVSSNKKDVVK